MNHLERMDWLLCNGFFVEFKLGQTVGVHVRRFSCSKPITGHTSRNIEQLVTYWSPNHGSERFKAMGHNEEALTTNLVWVVKEALYEGCR